MNSSKKIKVSDIIGIIIIVILVALIACTFILYGVFSDSNSAPSLFGRRIYLMNGDGMEPRIKNGSAVFIEEGQLPGNVGSVILCNINGKLAVVGYVDSTEVTLADGSVETRYIVKYDSTPSDQTWTVKSEDIIGRAISYDVFLGTVIRFASSKEGMLTVVILPCAILVIYEILMLFFAVRKNRKAAEIEQSQYTYTEAPLEPQNPADAVLDFKTAPSKSKKSAKEAGLFFGVPERHDEPKKTVKPIDFDFGEVGRPAEKEQKKVIDFSEILSEPKKNPAENIKTIDFSKAPGVSEKERSPEHAPASDKKSSPNVDFSGVLGVAGKEHSPEHAQVSDKKSSPNVDFSGVFGVAPKTSTDKASKPEADVHPEKTPEQPKPKAVEAPKAVSPAPANTAPKADAPKPAPATAPTVDPDREARIRELFRLLEEENAKHSGGSN